MAEHWINSYLGRPWRADCEGPEAFDCKGLVRVVQACQWGRDVPPLLQVGPHTDWAEVRASCQRSGWQLKAEGVAAAEGDILLVRGLNGPHVGVFVQLGRRLLVLHAHGLVRGGRQVGRVRLNALCDLLAGGYSRPQIWEFAE